MQVSIQADEAVLSDRLAGISSFDKKIEAARLVKELGWPLTLNVVLHRQNIDRIEAILGWVEELGADRVELANTQYYGWALAQPRRAAAQPRAARARRDRHARGPRAAARAGSTSSTSSPTTTASYPKPCMGGWGARQLVVGPEGDAWPCLAAHELPLPRANVREHDLAWIRESSPLFSAFRGTDWMPDPCASCDRREVDLGGCRCQAFQLTGDMHRTDPVCVLSPDRHLIDEAVAAANDPDAPASPGSGPGAGARADAGAGVPARTAPTEAPSDRR